ncbi:unnamed protein product [Malus baccata var. baccata]
MATVVNSSNSPSSPNSLVNLPPIEISNPSIMSIGSISIANSLERRFSDASCTHVHSLRSKIQTIQKGDSSITDYRNLIKDISDKLATAGEPISESDLIAYILSSLPDDYESFFDSIETHNESVMADELHSLLLSKEILLQKCKTRASSSPAAPFHAYAAQSNTSGAQFNRGNSRGRFKNQHRYNQNRNFGETNLTTGIITT